MTLAEKLEPILVSLEETLLETAINKSGPLGFSENSVRAATYIFSTIMLDQMWKLSENEKLDLKDRANLAVSLGNDLRKFIKTYTDIDTHELYKS
jgi:hypothetical protein